MALKLSFNKIALETLNQFFIQIYFRFYFRDVR